MKAAWLVIVTAALAGCAIANPRPAYYSSTAVIGGDRVLVVGVDRNGANQYAVDAMARELAFALSHRGRSAFDLSAFRASLDAAGRPLPEEILTRLRLGVSDAPTTAWLQAEQVRRVVFLDVQIYDQVWAEQGKRTRVGLSARGYDVVVGEEAWRAYATPDVEDEPGRGFQLATEAALGALARAITGEPEPFHGVPKIEDQSVKLPAVRVRW